MTEQEQQDAYYASLIADVTALEDSVSTEAYITELFQAVLGRDPSADGLANIVAAVDNGTFNVNDFIYSAINDDVENAAFDYLTDAEKAAAIITQNALQVDQTLFNINNPVTGDSGDGGDGGDGENPDADTKTILTDGRDDVTTGSGDDTVYAFVGQNQNGALANALATGDIIDGGAGTNDKIIATLMNDGTVADGTDFAPMPVVDNVEEIRVQALEVTVVNNTVVLDSDHITGENHYASDSSRADLVITNVDITDTQITNDITLEMKDTQQYSDLEVYFNETDLKAAPDVVAASAEFFIQVADGNAANIATPIANIKFDLEFTQNGVTQSFTDLQSTDGTYAGLVTAIQVALIASGLTGYTVELGDEFDVFETNSGDISLPYTGNFVTVNDDAGTAFDSIAFTPSQLDPTELAVILAQSDVNSEVLTSSSVVESTIILDNVGRGSNGGEVVIGSTSNSDSSTGVEIINVIVENDSVVHDISSTNSTLDKITLTNGTVKGDFVLTNNDALTDNDELYGNVDETAFDVGLTSITATNFDGDIVLGRDSDIVDLLTLSANVNGDVTYNATLNDSAAYVAVTGNGADTLTIALDDNIVESDTTVNTTVTINTGNSADVITLSEDITALENTEATVDAGAGDDVITGGAVSTTIAAGAGDDVVYAENTGDKALLNIATSGLYAASIPATDAAPIGAPGGIHFLDGREVTVTISVDGVGAGLLTNGYESDAIEITASTGSLTTLADLNNAVLKAINEDDVLNKIATAYIDENNNVAVSYLIDGAQVAGSVELEITDPATVPTVSTAMATEYRDLVNDSSLTTAVIQGIYNLPLAGTTASTDVHEGSTIQVTGFALAADTVTVMVGDDAISYVGTGAVATDSDALADALLEAGYYAESDGVDTVSVVTDQEVLFNSTGVAVAAATVTDNVALTSADIAMLLGSDSDVTTNALNAANTNVVNGNSGDDVIVLSSDDTIGDTVVYTDYSQGDDAIVNFETAVDQLDFTSYLTGTVEGNLSGSGSVESEVPLANTASATEVFTANSINLIEFNALTQMSATATFETVTIAELTAALNTDASNSIGATAVGSLYNDAKSVLIIHDNANGAGAVLGDTQDDGTYKAYELTYDNALADAGVAVGVDKAFTVKLIGSFDLADNDLAVGDFVL